MLNKDRDLLNQWNNTNTEYEDDLCIHHKLEQIATKLPDNKAISFKDETLSYSELNSAANAMANLLISKNVKVEDFVIVYLGRSLELITSIFGVLKSGGAYVPISYDYPKDRISSIIDDVKPKAIITSQELSMNLPDNSEVILVDNFLNELSDLNKESPISNVKPNNIAYAIFTSGTTGRPKGVLIEHRSVLNRIGWMQKMYPINTNDVLMQKTTITFDVSVWELFWASFVGAKLVLIPNGDEKLPNKILNYISKEKVSIIHFVPSMLNTFVKYLWSIYPENHLQSLKWLICSGEELYQNLVLDYYKLNDEYGNNSCVVNLYGPTEATVDVTFYTCKKNNVPDKIPIGKPIDNTEIYIIDEENKILPHNETGELVICGVNLARGYINREELTNEKFITLDVFGKSVRAYKTGDYAFFNENGDLIYKGRIDKQVKLRGFRIELGEIENTILGLENISDCACIVVNEKEETAKIIAFIISKNGYEIHPDKINDSLKSSLPEYMLPSNYYQVDEFPLSKSGKLDKDALLNKTEAVKNTNENLKTSNYEKKLIEVWSKILKVKAINPNSNFFDLGGNSLLLVQLSISLKKEMGIDVSVVNLMQYPTVKSLAAFLKKK